MCGRDPTRRRIARPEVGYKKGYLSGFFNIGLMLEKFKGCLLGAAIGDALGMPNESGAPNLNKMKYGYRRPYKGHPNDGLNPGQFTDDTQMMILVATFLRMGNSTRCGT